MKAIILIMALGSTAMADSTQYFVNQKPVTKTEALISLVKDPSAKVVKCQEQELSKKATIVNK